MLMVFSALGPNGVQTASHEIDVSPGQDLQKVIRGVMQSERWRDFADRFPEPEYISYEITIPEMIKLRVTRLDDDE